MSDLKEVAKVAELRPGEKKTVRLGLSKIIVVNLNGEFYAIGSRCTHLHLSFAEGSLDGEVITCPHHGSQFNVKTGAIVKGPAHKPLSTYNLAIQGDAIFVSGKNAQVKE